MTTSDNTDFNHGYNEPDYQTNDPPTYQGACMGLMVCPHCGKGVMCGDVQFKDEGKNNMINRSSSQQGNGNQSGNQSRKRNGLPFLSTDQATVTPQPGKIISARIEPDNFRKGQDVVSIRVEFKGQHWIYNLRSNNPVTDVLCDAFGNDETQWANKKIVIFNEEDAHNGKLWLRFDEAQEQEPQEAVTREPVTTTRQRKSK